MKDKKSKKQKKELKTERPCASSGGGKCRECYDFWAGRCLLGEVR